MMNLKKYTENVKFTEKEQKFKKPVKSSHKNCRIFIKYVKKNEKNSFAKYLRKLKEKSVKFL